MLDHVRDVQEFVQRMLLVVGDTKASPSPVDPASQHLSHPRRRGTGKDQLCLTDWRML